MKKLLAASLLLLLNPFQLEASARSFSGDCQMREYHSNEIINLSCVVSTQRNGLYDNRDKSKRSWSIVVKEITMVRVECLPNGRGIMSMSNVKGGSVDTQTGECRGLRNAGILYLNFTPYSNPNNVFNFPQW